jgi:hypothetical protein
MVTVTLTDVPAEIFDAATVSGRKVEDYIIDVATEAAAQTFRILGTLEDA